MVIMSVLFHQYGDDGWWWYAHIHKGDPNGQTDIIIIIISIVPINKIITKQLLFHYVWPTIALRSTQLNSLPRPIIGHIGEKVYSN